MAQAIGSYASGDYSDYGVMIGTKADVGKGSIVLGCNSKAPGKNNILIGIGVQIEGDNKIQIGDVDIRLLLETVQKLTQRIEELETHIEFMPGGAGYTVAECEFNNISSQLESDKQVSVRSLEDGF
jgi:hypothetical protein